MEGGRRRWGRETGKRRERGRERENESIKAYFVPQKEHSCFTLKDCSTGWRDLRDGSSSSWMI